MSAATPGTWGGMGNEENRGAITTDTELSDFPEDASEVEFRGIQWPPYANCDVPDPPKKCDIRTGRRSHRHAMRLLGGRPLPNRHCPLSCSHRGTCLAPFADREAEAVERYPLGGGADYCPHPNGPSAPCQPASARPAGGAACICHRGYSGEGCELTDDSLCFNHWAARVV